MVYIRYQNIDVSTILIEPVWFGIKIKNEMVRYEPRTVSNAHP